MVLLEGGEACAGCLGRKQLLSVRDNDEGRVSRICTANPIPTHARPARWAFKAVRTCGS